ncbi:MAG: hypothetical protein K8T20_19335 [Planctomycetes bacterium]|nr:hypothetical protein [Planctomycetota bacterium]
MELSAARKIVGPRKLGAGKRLVAWALLASVLVCTSGCASHNWAFGTSRWATGADADAYSTHVENPKIIVFVPCFLFDCIVFPIAIVHDMWPRSPGSDVDD